VLINLNQYQLIDIPVVNNSIDTLGRYGG